MNIKEEIEKLNSERESIGKRAAEIKGELENADEETTLKLKAELGKLDKRSKEIPLELESLEKKREEEAASIFQETQKQEELHNQERKKSMENEELAKRLEDLGQKLIRGERVPLHLRDILISTTGITNPSKTEEQIRPGYFNGNSLLDLFDSVPAKGQTSWPLPIEGADPTAGAGTDGSPANNSDPVFKKATLVPEPINVVTYVSKHIASYTPTEYYKAVAVKAIRAVRKKVLDVSVARMQVGKTDDNQALYDNVSATVTAFDEKFLRKMLLNYGAGDTVIGGVALVLSKQALLALGDVRGTNEKQAVYKIEFDPEDNDTGIISENGMSARFFLNASLHGANDETVIAVKPAAYTLAQFEEVMVSVSRDEKFSSGLLSVLAECSIGGNLNCFHGAEFTTI